MTLKAGKAAALRSDGRRRSLRLTGQKLLMTLRGPQFPIGPEDPGQGMKNGGHSSKKSNGWGTPLREPFRERALPLQGR